MLTDKMIQKPLIGVTPHSYLNPSLEKKLRKKYWCLFSYSYLFLQNIFLGQKWFQVANQVKSRAVEFSTYAIVTNIFACFAEK